MQKVSMVLMICTALALPAFNLSGAETEKGEAKQEQKAKEEKIALKDLPKAVLEAAQGAVKGIELTEAAKITRGDQVVYEIDGKVGAKEYEITVSAEGKVLKVQEEKPEAEKDGDQEQADDDKDEDKDDDKENGEDKDD